MQSWQSSKCPREHLLCSRESDDVGSGEHACADDAVPCLSPHVQSVPVGDTDVDDLGRSQVEGFECAPAQLGLDGPGEAPVSCAEEVEAGEAFHVQAPHAVPLGSEYYVFTPKYPRLAKVAITFEGAEDVLTILDSGSELNLLNKSAFHRLLQQVEGRCPDRFHQLSATEDRPRRALKGVTGSLMPILAEKDLVISVCGVETLARFSIVDGLAHEAFLSLQTMGELRITPCPHENVVKGPRGRSAPLMAVEGVLDAEVGRVVSRVLVKESAQLSNLVVDTPVLVGAADDVSEGIYLFEPRIGGKVEAYRAGCCIVQLRKGHTLRVPVTTTLSSQTLRQGEWIGVLRQLGHPNPHVFGTSRLQGKPKGCTQSGQSVVDRIALRPPPHPPPYSTFHIQVAPGEHERIGYPSRWCGCGPFHITGPFRIGRGPLPW